VESLFQIPFHHTMQSLRVFGYWIVKSREIELILRTLDDRNGIFVGVIGVRLMIAWLVSVMVGVLMIAWLVSVMVGVLMIA